jgi:putative CocE/NonD family hydrolase
MGENVWRDEQEWPIARTRHTPLYLTGGHTLATEPRAAGHEEFFYDPNRPVPTRGGAVCCNPKIFPWGPMDQRQIESRPDVLVYSTPALKEDIEVTGDVSVVLYVSTSAPDTDFTAKLIDVLPNGEARNLCDGILRMRYREGLDKPRLAKPGQVYALTIPAGVTSNLFKVGHRIRVEISSSNFPRFDRNPNTGRPVADDRELRIARQTIFYGSGRPSHVVLPVIP